MGNLARLYFISSYHILMSSPRESVISRFPLNLSLCNDEDRSFRTNAPIKYEHHHYFFVRRKSSDLV